MQTIRNLSLTTVLLVMALSVYGQTQNGYVRTVGRPDNKEGKRIAGVEIRFRGKHNAVVCNKKGAFSVTIDGGESYYIINSVSREGYELQEKELLGRKEPFSESVPKEIVMISLKEKKMIEEKVRRQVESKYQEKLERLQRELNGKTISEERYKAEMQRLNDEYDLRDRLVQDMVERYASTDYARMSAKEAEINAFIENGELEKADSVINTLNISKLESDRASLIRDIEAKERQIAAERTAVSSIDSTLWIAYRAKVDIFYADFQNDSAAYYLEKLLTLDTGNIQLMIELGAFYDCYLANSGKAIHHLNKAIGLMKGDSTSIYLTMSMNDIALCYHRTGKLDSMKTCLDEALRLARIQGNRYREALALSNMSNYYSEKSDIENEKRCIEESKAIYTSLYGEKNEYIITSYNKLAAMYISKSEYSKAIECVKKALGIMPVNKEIYTRIMPCYNNMGLAYIHLGKLDSAEYYCNKAVELTRTLFGDNHPDMASVLGNLSSIHNRKGDYGKALEIRLRALAIDIAFFKDYHSSIATDYGNLSTIYGNLRQQDSSLHYALEALRIFNVIDTLSPSLIYIYSNIGSAYTSMGKLNMALGYFVKADQLVELYPDVQRENAATLYLEIGNLFQHAGMYEKALAYYEESLRILNEIYDRENIEYFTLYHNIGTLYSKSDNAEKAIEYFTKADKLLADYGKSESKEAANNAKSIGVVYHKMKEYDTALVYLKKSLEITVRHYGDNSTKTLPVLSDISESYYKKGTADSAVVYAMKEYDIYVSHKLTEDQSFWSTCMMIYANLRKSDRTDEYRKFMADKTFVADVIPEGVMASKGYEGRYYVLEWKGWNVTDTANFVDEYTKDVTPLRVMVYRDGQIQSESFDGKAGAMVHMQIVGRETKEEILKAYSGR